MIQNASDYHRAQDEIRSLEDRLQRLQATNPLGSKGFTKAGICKLIAQLQEELALFEASAEARQSPSH
jgi:hypothetical protein